MAKLVHKEQSYTGGGDTSDLIKWSEAKTSVKKNLLKNSLKSGTLNGYTKTANSDGTVTINGSPVDSSVITVFDLVNTELLESWTIEAGTYEMSCEGLVLNDSYMAITYVTKDNQTVYDFVRIPERTGTFTITAELLANIKNWYIGLVIMAGKTISNVTYKPMIRLASIVDDTYEPYIKDNVELDADKAGKTQITNPNLLDNPWFTVNQRGASQYTAIGYTVDRWRIWSAGTVDVSEDNGICTNSLSLLLYHYIGDISTTKKLLGKTLTLSVLLSDGTILSETGVCPSTIPTEWTFPFININGTGVTARVDVDPNAKYVLVAFSSTVYVRAVKLELGSVSTLALDTAPNYASELLKCQRYFVKFPYLSTSGWCTNAGKSYDMPVLLPTRMRTVPSVKMDGYYARIDGGYSQHTPTFDVFVSATTLTIYNVYNTSLQNLIVRDTIGTAVDTNNALLSFVVKNLELSADL